MKKLLVAVSLVLSASAGAQERITSYDSQVDVRKDGSIDVTERISVHAEGNQIRRGIYRDFPTRYQDRFSNRVKVDLEVLAVERDGKREPWFTEKLTNGVRINTGNDDFLTVPADYVYTIHYRTTRQLGFFQDHDELYWNAIGAGWVFPIEKGTVEVRLPGPVPINQMSSEAYTGPQGTKGNSYVTELPSPGVARYRLTNGLGPYEAFTTVLTFPKGLVAAPQTTEKAGWFLRDNRGVLVAIVGLIGLLFYTFRTWQRIGRDPAKGIVIARYEPGVGQTPAGVRFMTRMGYDMRCFTGDVLALAVAGYVRIRQEEGFLKKEWQLIREHPAVPQPISPGQHELLEHLFSRDDTLVLKNTNASLMSAAVSKHTKILDTEFQPRYFKRNGKQVGTAVLIAVVTAMIAFVSSGGFGIPAIIGVGALMLLTVIVFGFLVRAPTDEGRQLLDEIEGLKLYMSVAEKQELASMGGPDSPVLDAKRYEALLPYAVALDVEDAWTKKFTAAAGAAAAAAAAQGMSWYSGRGPINNLGDFSRSVGSSLNSSISSASTPPGSSSGSGGGGSSGGGGGGGGGGGR